MHIYEIIYIKYAYIFHIYLYLYLDHFNLSLCVIFKKKQNELKFDQMRVEIPLYNTIRTSSRNI